MHNKRDRTVDGQITHYNHPARETSQNESSGKNAIKDANR